MIKVMMNNLREMFFDMEQTVGKKILFLSGLTF